MWWCCSPLPQFQGNVVEKLAQESRNATSIKLIASYTTLIQFHLMTVALNKMKTGIDPGPSEVSLELIAASGLVGIQVMAEICQGVLDGLGVPVDRVLSKVVLIFKAKGDIRNCSCYRGEKLFELGTKVAERVLEKQLCRILTVDKKQLGFMPERGAIERRMQEAIDAVFILRRMQEVYHAKGKRCICLLWT